MTILTRVCVLLLIVPSLFCADNASAGHAKKTVDLLRGLDSGIRIGMTVAGGKEQLAAAYNEYRQISEKEVDPLVYASLGLSITSYQLVLDSDARLDREIKFGPARPLSEQMKEYKDRLKQDLDNAETGCETAAKHLGV